MAEELVAAKFLVSVNGSDLKEFAVKYVYEDWEPTIDGLCECLSADELCEYLKDKGVGLH